MNFLEHEPLSRHTAFRVGGPARFFVEVENEKDLGEAVMFAREKNIPLFLLGRGSNILVGDKGFPGLVIQLSLSGFSFSKEEKGCVRATAFSGSIWDEFVAESAARKLWGIENMSWIPGTVGAAVVGNIGAYGEEVKDTIESVVAVSAETGEKIVFKKNDLDFLYRSSFFKTPKGRPYIVVSATFLLSTKPAPVLSYKDVKEYFKDRIPEMPEEVREAVIAIRTAKLPDWRVTPTAGSYFKNPYIEEAVYEKLKTEFSDLPAPRKENGMIKMSAAWLIDRVCGLKGFTKGDVSTHDRQALVIVNRGRATARDIRAFGDMIAKTVFEKTGITLEPEVEFVGEF